MIYEEGLEELFIANQTMTKRADCISIQGMVAPRRGEPCKGGWLRQGVEGV